MVNCCCISIEFCCKPLGVCHYLLEEAHQMFHWLCVDPINQQLSAYLYFWQHKNCHKFFGSVMCCGFVVVVFLAFPSELPGPALSPGSFVRNSPPPPPKKKRTKPIDYWSQERKNPFECFKKYQIHPVVDRTRQPALTQLVS